MAEKDKMPTAHSLEEAANSDNSLEGYAAMNEDEHSEIAKLAYALYEQRGGNGGSAEEDWFRAEREYRKRKGGESSGGDRAREKTRAQERA